MHNSVLNIPTLLPLLDSKYFATYSQKTVILQNFFAALFCINQCTCMLTTCFTLCLCHHTILQRSLALQEFFLNTRKLTNTQKFQLFMCFSCNISLQLTICPQQLLYGICAIQLSTFDTAHIFYQLLSIFIYWPQFKNIPFSFVVFHLFHEFLCFPTATKTSPY